MRVRQGSGYSVTGSGNGVEGTSANTPSTIVKRDASGNFSTGTITGNITGSAGSLSAASILPAGTTAMTQSTSDNSIKVATTAYADSAARNAVIGAVSAKAASGTNADITGLTEVTVVTASQGNGLTLSTPKLPLSPLSDFGD